MKTRLSSRAASHLFISYRDIAEPGRFENTRDAILKLNPRLRLTDTEQIIAELDLAPRMTGYEARARPGSQSAEVLAVFHL